MKNPVLIKVESDPLAGFSRTEFIGKIAEALRQKDVEKAWFFGSFARDDLTPWSDIDLIVVHNTILPFPERFREFPELFLDRIALDLLVYTPGEWEKIQNEDSIGFWKSIKADMLSVFAAT